MTPQYTDNEGIHSHLCISQRLFFQLLNGLLALSLSIPLLLLRLLRYAGRLHLGGSSSLSHILLVPLERCLPAL